MRSVFQSCVRNMASGSGHFCYSWGPVAGSRHSCSMLWVHGFLSVNLFVTFFFSLSTWLIRFSLPCALLSCLGVGLSTWFLFMSQFVPQCIWTPLPLPCWPVICLVTSPVCFIWLSISASVRPVCVDLVPVHFGCYTCQSVFFLCLFSGSWSSVQVLGLRSALRRAFCLFNRCNPIYLIDLANDF